MKSFVLSLIFLGTVLAVPAQVTKTQPMIEESCSGMSVGPNGALNGFAPSPYDAWHQDVSAAPIDPNSAKIINTVGDLGEYKLHPDFGSIAGGNYGIPYNVVDSSQTPNVPVNIKLYGSESDITVAPVPANAIVEGAPKACISDGNDRHMIVLDRHKCVAYEYWQASTCNSAWSASTGVLFDISETEQRPYAYTSADAGGLSVFEGLVRYDEIIAGSINHAIRFTAKFTKDDAHNGYFTAPATHAAGNLWGTDNIMGMRIRLKASFDISKYSTTNQIILKAMKQYGMILADNGGTLFFQGTADARWNDSDLGNLKNVPATAFDVVQMAPIYDSSTAPKGAAPTITSFTAATPTVAAGTPVVLTAVVSNASYSYVDKGGFVRGGVVTVTPSATTTYTLTSRNAFGSKTASVTVAVGEPLKSPNLSMSFTQAGTNVFTAALSTLSPATPILTIISGSATLNSRTVTRTGAGAVVVQAYQAATAAYAAQTITATIPAALLSPQLSMSFTEVSPSVYTAVLSTKVPNAPVLTVASGPATVNFRTITRTGNGPVVIRAYEPASGQYAAATVTGTLPTPAPLLSPGLAMSFTRVSSNVFTAVISTKVPNVTVLTVVSGTATVKSRTITRTGNGPVVIRASEPASGLYAAATVTGTIPGVTVITQK